MAPRLDESSKAVKLLRKRMSNGEITGDDDYKSVQAAEPVFQEYKPDTFRTRFNKLKREYFDEFGEFTQCFNDFRSVDISFLTYISRR